MALRELDCGLCTRRWCAILKENALCSFIRTGSAVLIAPDDRLVGFRPSGVVESEAERQRAIQLAQGMEGVKRVDANKLLVKR